jgi:hypothetical protein
MQDWITGPPPGTGFYWIWDDEGVYFCEVYSNGPEDNRRLPALFVGTDETIYLQGRPSVRAHIPIEPPTFPGGGSIRQHA